VKAIVDTNLPKALAAWLSANGFEARHVLDAGLAQASDSNIWEVASRTGEIIFSKDQDFADRVKSTTAGPSVVWLRTGNGTNRDLIALLGKVLPAILTRLNAGDRLIEVR